MVSIGPLIPVPLSQTGAKKRRGGLTLTEVIVVIAILAVLGAILLPAIHRARVRARTVACASQLRQIALALVTHESAQSHYPAAMSEMEKGGIGKYSGFVRLLPYLEQTPLYDAINFQIPTISSVNPNPASVAANRTVIATKIELFLCPSDGRRELSWPGPTNYAFNVGSSPWIYNSDFNLKSYPGAGNGAFAIYKAFGSAAFRDGLEYTVALSERLIGDGSPLRFDPKRDVWHVPAGNTQGMTADGVAKVCASYGGQYPGMQHFSWTGLTWFYGRYPNTFYNHVATPNSASVACDLRPPPNSGTGSYPARSFHGGGVNAAMMGGSVRFVNDRVDLHIWRGLATRDGGEVVPSNF